MDGAVRHLKMDDTLPWLVAWLPSIGLRAAVCMVPEINGLQHD